MQSLMRKLAIAYDSLRNRFETRIGSGPEDLATCVSLRKQVFGEELKRGSAQGLTVGDADELDEVAIHLICQDTVEDRVAGVCRVMTAKLLKDSSNYREEYQLELFPGEMLERIHVGQRLCVLKEYRSHVPSLLLMLKSYEIALGAGITLGLTTCEPGLFPLYRRFGFRPYHRLHVSPFGGYRIPVLLVLHDYDYLRRTSSPYLDVARKLGFPRNVEGMNWYYHHQQPDQDGVGLTLLDEARSDSINATIFDGLSVEGREQLLKHGILIKCKPGDRVVAEGGGESFMGLVRKGALVVRRGETTITVLNQGELFGEIAFLLKIPRSASLIAATPNTEVVLLSAKALDRLKSREDQLRFWQNMSTILAERIIAAR